MTGTAGPAATVDVRTMTPMPTPTASRTLTRARLTIADNERSVTTHVGVSLVMVLTPDTGGPLCLHATPPCGVGQRVWRVHVIVR
jgi:hypothetical protein